MKTILMLLLPLLACFGLYLWFQIAKYKRTEYFKQTGNSYFSVLFDKGRLGEYYTYRYLKGLKGTKKFLFNIYFPKDNGETTETDVLLLHDSGIYVFESKNYSGWIFGTETQPYWTQTLPTGRKRSHKSRFFNPILQNKVHLKWLHRYLEDERLPMYSYIVFSDRCTLKDITLTSAEHHVINRYNILPAVKENSKRAGKLLTPEQIDVLYEKLYPLTQVDKAQKLAHVEAVRQKQQAAQQSAAPAPGEVPVCPYCNIPLVRRTTRKGPHAGESFWGCSNYPKCKFTKKCS